MYLFLFLVIFLLYNTNFYGEKLKKILKFIALIKKYVIISKFSSY